MSKSNIIFLIIAGLVLGWSYFTSAKRDDESGYITQSGSMDIFEVRVGDCTDEDIGEAENETYTSLNVVPCSELHDSEFYASHMMEDGEFPGNEYIEQTALELCLTSSESFVGIGYQESILDISYLFPTEESWNTSNDREILCAIYHMEGEKLADSAKNLRI